MSQSRKYMEHIELNVIHSSINHYLTIWLEPISAVFRLDWVTASHLSLSNLPVFGLGEDAGEDPHGRTLHSWTRDLLAVSHQQR